MSIHLVRELKNKIKIMKEVLVVRSKRKTTFKISEHEGAFSYRTSRMLNINEIPEFTHNIRIKYD